MKVTHLKQFKYLESFKCIGSLCEDTCCVGWDVDIDQGTFAYYQSLGNEPLATKIKAKVKPNMTCGDKNIDFASVILNPNKHCPFLDHEKLCEIQRSYGEKALSNVCSNFPRFYNQVDHVLEITGTFSCPEIARIALSDAEMMETIVTPITQKELSTKRIIYSKRVDTSDAKNNHPAIQFIDSIRDGMDFILSLPISTEKSIELIGLYIEMIQKLSVENQLGTFESVNQEFLSGLGNALEQQKIQNLSRDEGPAIQGVTLLDFYYQKLKVGSEVTDKRFINMAETACHGMGKQKGVAVKKYGAHWIETYNQRTLQLLEQHRALFKNDLRHYIHKNLFPFNGTQNLNASFRLLVIRYAQLIWFVTGLSVNISPVKEASQIQLIELIQIYSKTIEHHKTYLDAVHEHLSLLGDIPANRFARLAYLGSYIGV